MLRASAVALLLLSCDYISRVTDADGTVYDCGSAEFCYYADSAAELSDLTGLSCSRRTVSDRWWPGLTNAVGRGCRYCCGDACGPGANAKDGAWCP